MGFKDKKLFNRPLNTELWDPPPDTPVSVPALSPLNRKS